MNDNPELIEAIKIAEQLGVVDLTSFLVCTTVGDKVRLSLHMEDADLFALWAHLTGVLLGGVSDKQGAMRAMVMALALHGIQAHVAEPASTVVN